MKKLFYHIGKLNEAEQWKLDFKDALSRTVLERIELGFVLIKLPVINDASYRIFDTMKEYRHWANKNLPKYLGYYTCD